jgi:hypothetical protein
VLARTYTCIPRAVAEEVRRVRRPRAQLTKGPRPRYMYPLYIYGATSLSNDVYDPRTWENLDNKRRDILFFF